MLHICHQVSSLVGYLIGYSGKYSAETQTAGKSQAQGGTITGRLGSGHCTPARKVQLFISSPLRLLHFLQPPSIITTPHPHLYRVTFFILPSRGIRQIRPRTSCDKHDHRSRQHLRRFRACDVVVPWHSSSRLEVSSAAPWVAWDLRTVTSLRAHTEQRSFRTVSRDSVNRTLSPSPGRVVKHCTSWKAINALASDVLGQFLAHLQRQQTNQTYLNRTLYPLCRIVGAAHVFS